jgi:SAM-dependent methyltransferase
LDDAAVKAFFERRSKKLKALGPLTTTMYQTEDLARRRDQWEKTAITPLLGVTSSSRILDIGCGTGRWAQAVAADAESYLGVDFCPAYVDACRDVLREARLPMETHRAQILRAQDVEASVLNLSPPFTHVIIAGVLTFLNDDDVLALMHRLPGFCTPRATLYLREPVGLDSRLTLKAEPSVELEDEYHAIYRPATFYRNAINSVFTIGCTVLDQLLFPEALSNRAETAQHVFIAHRTHATSRLS